MNIALISVVVLLVVIPLIVFISNYNGIIGAKNNCKRAWADVLNYETAKIKILDGITNVVQEHNKYEQGVLEKITELRSSIVDLKSEGMETGKLKQVEMQTDSLLNGLNIQMEAYPEILRALYRIS